MLTLQEIQILMPLIEAGSKKVRRKIGDLGFAAQFGLGLSSALPKLQQMADAANASDGQSSEADPTPTP